MFYLLFSNTTYSLTSNRISHYVQANGGRQDTSLTDCVITLSCLLQDFKEFTINTHSTPWTRAANIAWNWHAYQHQMTLAKYLMFLPCPTFITESVIHSFAMSSANCSSQAFIDVLTMVLRKQACFALLRVSYKQELHAVRYLSKINSERSHQCSPVCYCRKNTHRVTDTPLCTLQ